MSTGWQHFITVPYLLKNDTDYNFEIKVISGKLYVEVNGERLIDGFVMEEDRPARGFGVFNSKSAFTVKDLTIAEIAKEEPPVPTYTVTFDSKGGSAVEQVMCAQGETLTAPQAPERKGYSFEGWYTDESCEHAYDFNSPVTGNMTLYAKWSKAGGCAGCGSGTAVPLTGALLLFAAGVLFKGRKH